ncbi:condensin complex subunit 2 domain-containing protein [Ditylenchus destructor]|uniref:Condensin complex subunit 2 n=1 Tax=Ditylenchus destructor TaxID=166010 RepID=A0AAD4NCU4_9BILA|nr:condensin complex subunit 2 domain-containing protein [Ditylenchus destructor]
MAEEDDDECSNGPGPSGLSNGNLRHHRMNRMCGNDPYDNETAVSIFTNAPKVTRRALAPHSSSRATAQEEDTNAYNENDPEENERIAKIMQECLYKKINASNAFETPLIDKLPQVVEVERLQCVGTMLDASARVYAYRVDNAHGECFTIRTTIDEGKTKKLDERSESPRKRKADNVDDEENGDIDIDRVSNHEEPDENSKQKLKKTRVREIPCSEVPGRTDDLYRKTFALVDQFSALSMPQDEMSDERLSEELENYSSRMQEYNTSRRVGVPFLNEKPGGIDRADEEYRIDDPIYYKVTKEFEEGCAHSFVNNEVLSNSDGTFLILHTNWKNNELNAIPRKAGMKNMTFDPMFKELAGSLERALAPEPCNLRVLQEFCADDDEADAGLSEIRLLGRASQPARRVTEALARLSGQSPSIHDEETASMIDFTEEERARKEHEELLKFRMYIEEELKDDSESKKKDPFDGQQFFETDFTEYAKEEECSSEIAILHTLDEQDSARFGISSELLTQLKEETKVNRYLPLKTLERLLEAIGPNNQSRFESIFNIDALTQTGVSSEESQQAIGRKPTEYLITRFAPLIDTLWHAEIKDANEAQLAKIGIPVGGARFVIPRSVRKADGSVASKRTNSVRPYMTPLRTPVRMPHPPLSSRATPETVISMELNDNTRKTKRGVSSTSSKKIPVSRLKFTPSTSRRISPVPINLSDDETEVSSQADQQDEFRKNRIYFWARPRTYPVVYAGQAIDEKDTPMSDNVTDIDDALGVNIAQQKQNDLIMDLTSVEQPDIEIINMANDNIDEANDFENNSIPPEKIAVDDTVMENGQNDDANGTNLVTTTGDKNTMDVSPSEPNATIEGSLQNNGNTMGDALADFHEQLSENRPASSANDTDDSQLDHLQPAANDILDILQDDHNSLLGDLNDIEELDKSRTQAAPELHVEDDSHWIGGPNANADAEQANRSELSKKEKKDKAPTKPKRQRLNSDAPVSNTEMYWGNRDDVPPEILQAIGENYEQSPSVSNAFPADGQIDIVGHGPVHITDLYDPNRFIPHTLLYKRKSGYWKPVAGGGKEFVSFRKGFALRSVEEEHLDAIGSFTRGSAKKRKGKKNTNTEDNNAAHDLNAIFGDEDNSIAMNHFDMTQRTSRSPSPGGDVVQVADDEQQMEFNGGVIEVRQSRIKAPMIKKAIAAILSSNDLDVSALKNIMQFSPVQINGIVATADGNTNDNEPDYMFSDESDADEGQHTYASLMTFMPDYLSGKTKQDLNVINGFAVMLHMCNEHGLYLRQDINDKTGLISEEGMSSFSIENAKK